MRSQVVLAAMAVQSIHYAGNNLQHLLLCPHGGVSPSCRLASRGRRVRLWARCVHVGGSMSMSMRTVGALGVVRLAITGGLRYELCHLQPASPCLC